MHGIVNKAIKGLILQEYDEAAWQKIKQKSGVNIDIFLSNESYDDSLTYDLAIAASEVLEVPLADILKALGEYWILRTGMDNYGSLLKSGGDDLKEFLVNLPNFHSRIMLMFPDLKPPEFRISEIEDNSLNVHYYSHRDALQPFVEGLLKGCGKMYKTEAEVEMIEGRHDGLDHDVFKVSW